MRSAFTLCGCLLLLWGCKNPGGPATDSRQPALYTIQQLYKTKSIGNPSFNRDETAILVNNNETGIYNVYEISLRDSSMKARTHSVRESFFAADYVPGSDRFIYSSDQGGNENSHLFLQETDGSVKDLTPGEKEKANFYGWNKKKDALYYSSNKRDPRYFDLYKMDTAGWKPKLIYQNNEGFDISGISFHEQYLLLGKSITSDKNELYLLDLASQKLKKLSSDSAEATYSAQGFESSDSAFYYLTNEGREFSYLVRYDIASGQRHKVYETNWDVSYMALSENDKYRVVGINEDGRDKVLLFDQKTGERLSFPELPEGNVEAVTISPSEKNLILSVASDKSPVNLYYYNLRSGELRQLTRTLNPEVNPADLVAAQVVRFKSFDGLDIPAIFYKPQQSGPGRKVPALVWVHGGPGGQSRVGYSQSIQYLVNHGYAILAVNNRGSSGYGKTFYKLDNRDHGDRDLMDCVYGKKWLAAQDYIDSSKIGIYGGSYGGFMSLAGIIFHPQEFKVGVDLFGVANWPRTLKNVPPYWESFKKALYEEMGDPNGPDSTRLKNISPLYNTEKIHTPLLVLQGANDPRVLPQESNEIVMGARRNGSPVEYVLFPDEGHGFIKKENQMKAAEVTLKFLDKYLRGDKPAKLN